MPFSCYLYCSPYAFVNLLATGGMDSEQLSTKTVPIGRATCLWLCKKLRNAGSLAKLIQKDMLVIIIICRVSISQNYKIESAGLDIQSVQQLQILIRFKLYKNSIKLVQLSLFEQYIGNWQKLSQQLQNKMSSTKNIDFHQYCGDLSESIDYLQSQMGNQSPIYKNNLSSFRSFPKHMTAYPSDTDLLDAFSVEEEIINHHPCNTSKYKCFKCYGTNREDKPVNQNETACTQCEGTALISDSHALAHILEKVLMLKLPTLINRSDQWKKEDGRKNRQMHSLFGSQNSIQQQESCSYYPDERSQQCSSCYKQQQVFRMFGCKQCKDYFVCVNCYEKKKYNHPLDHLLFNKETHKISLRICPTTMKKISQEGELEDNSNYLDSSQSLEIKCHQCNKLIQECYEACLDCEKEGFQFIICAQCSQLDSFTHQPGHELAMKTLAQASKLLRLSSKPSASESEATQTTPSKQKSKSKVKTKVSVIMFDNFETQDIQENHGISPIKNDFQQDEDLTHLLVKKKGKKMQKMQESVVSIDMQCSIEAASIQQDFTPTVIPYAFSNTSNQRLDQRNFNPEEYTFNGYECDICKVFPIKNKRYHCKLCENYDLCEMCYETRSKRHEHKEYELIDGLQIIKKNRQNLLTKIESNKNRLSLSRVSIAKTRFSEFSSFK